MEMAGPKVMQKAQELFPELWQSRVIFPVSQQHTGNIFVTSLTIVWLDHMTSYSKFWRMREQIKESNLLKLVGVRGLFKTLKDCVVVTSDVTIPDFEFLESDADPAPQVYPTTRLLKAYGFDPPKSQEAIEKIIWDT